MAKTGDAIKPWQHQSWIFIRDPNFRVKASQVLDLYARIWEGVPLCSDEYVISSDEKTSIQARCHPTLPPGKARMMRVNHEYDRDGALAYLAAYDVGQATVFGQCPPSTGIEPFMALVEHVMTDTSARLRVACPNSVGKLYRRAVPEARSSRSWPAAATL